MRLRLALLFSLAVLLVSRPALAQKPAPLPENLPSYGPIKPYVGPQVTQEKLSNGLTIWLVPRPGFPEISFVLAVRGGMASDPTDVPGFSQLLAATLTQGTKTRSAKEIAEQIEAAGGDLSARAAADDLIVSTEVLWEKSQATLSLLGDIAENANFPPDEVSLAKRNAAEDLQGEEAQPGFLARRELAQAIFGSHPYSVTSPTQDSIAKVTPELLRQEFARRFRPDQAILVAVGDFQPQALVAQVTSAFGAWARPSQPPIAPTAAPTQPNPHAIFMVPRPGSVQTTFVMGTFGPTDRDPDYAAAQVGNAIYGGMFSSRLITNIREDKGYTYSPGSFLQARSAVGVLETQADVRNAVTGASFNEIQYELNRMATTAPTPDEMSRAQRYLTGIQAIELQSEEAVAGRLASLWMDGLPPDELTKISADILKVTSQDVESIGAKYCPALRETIVAVGEPSVIEQQLAPFGIPIQTVP
jgi:predicted Zn-dependent peptidase